MDNKIIDKIQDKSQSILNSKIIKVIISSLVSIVLLVIILSGYSFSTVYSGLATSLILVGIISIWIRPLRSIFRWILVVGAIFYLGENIISAKIIPFLDNQISKNIPSYAEWKKTSWMVTDSKFGEGTISMKKELMNSEINKGVFGIITADSPAYDEKGEIIKNLFFKKGQKIMSLGLQSKPQLEGSEGMAYVLIANKYGDFVKSRSALVPIRKVEWENDKNIETSFTKSTAPEKAPEWELYKDFGECKFNFSGRIFAKNVGPNGERAYTGEEYSGCFLEKGYEYKITFKGEYEKLFTRLPFYKITWKGWTPQSEGINKPFPEYEYGALMLRISNQQGIHPEKELDFIIISDMEGAKIFGELNINREYAEYNHLTMGSKVQNSTLSIKIERRPLQR